MKKDKLKILLIGPSETGKTLIANTLADSGPKWSQNPRFKLGPTKALRIVEFDLNDLKVGNDNHTVEIELWDSSGDDQYRLCWPGLRHETDGIIFVYSKSSSEANRKLEILYHYFVTQPNLSPRQCLIIQSILKEDSDDLLLNSTKLSSTFSRLSQISTNLSTDPVVKLKNDFRIYITALLTFLKSEGKI